MAQVPFTSFYLGPYAVYTSPTGLTDPITGFPELGGTLHEGDYADITEAEAQQFAIRFGNQLHAGRYRFCRLNAAATASTVKFGYPLGLGLPSTLGGVAIVGAGTVTSGANGTYTVTSSAGGATALVTVVSAAITSAQLVNPGSGLTSVPTFGLTEITGYTGGAGPLLAQMAYSPNLVGSFDTTSSINITSVRGISLANPTAAQVLAGCWIVIQEEGIASVFVTTATNTASGSIAASATAGAVTTTIPGTPITTGALGLTLDLAAASTLVRTILTLPVQQG